MPVCTGKWGCGAFKGDHYLKFLIQWIACTLADRPMLFKIQEVSEQNELSVMSKYFKEWTVSDLVTQIFKYHKLS
jgi:poly(ADP-ribose) glycohydrolase